MKKQSMDRFGFIETKLFWDDGITARNLAETFDISRQAAQKIIDDYRQTHPGQMIYNSKTRRHEATDGFSPSYTRTDNPALFLDYLRGEAMVGLYRDEAEWSDFTVTDANRLLRPRLPLEAIRTVMSGLRNHRAVLIDYRKKDMESDQVTERVISPNHLVFVDNRYHIRAYCHLRETFLDFVLSRIVYAEFSEDDWVPTNEDRAWNDLVEIHLIPHPALPESVRQALLRNYETGNAGEWVITCRKALGFYIKRRLVQANDQKYGMPLWQISQTGSL